MEIIWYGQAFFKIKGKTATVLVDPSQSQEADIILRTSSGPKINGPRVFEGPGEYESKGVVITGVKSLGENPSTIFSIMIDGVTIVHLGSLSQKELTEEQVQEIDNVDILLVPVDLVSLVSKLEPKIVIPWLRIDSDDMEKFKKEMGAESVEPQPKLSITKDKLPEETTVVLLSKT